MPDPSRPRHSAAALLMVDVVNHFDFPDGDRTLAQALSISPQLARLKKRARSAGIPALYVNDNLGQWHSDSSKLLANCLRTDAPGRKFVEQIRPADDEYFLLKPMHSAFYQTPLEVLLRYLGATSLIICGLATNSCIICTAHDANMREFPIFVPADCCAARTRKEHRRAIEHISAMTRASVAPSTSLRLKEIARSLCPPKDRC